MKSNLKIQARMLRKRGLSIGTISDELNVSKSSVSVWVRDIKLPGTLLAKLQMSPYTSAAIEKRRMTRLTSERAKRDIVTKAAYGQVGAISKRELWLIGTALYWAEGGKTQRMVRFSNGDPRLIKIMVRYFIEVCDVPQEKLRGYIHIHDHLDYLAAESYWSKTTGISLEHFFKTYRRKTPVDKQHVKNSLPHGVMDIYVLDASLFLKIESWCNAIFDNCMPNLLK